MDQDQPQTILNKALYPAHNITDNESVTAGNL